MDEIDVRVRAELSGRANNVNDFIEHNKHLSGYQERLWLKIAEKEAKKGRYYHYYDLLGFIDKRTGISYHIPVPILLDAGLLDIVRTAYDNMIKLGYYELRDDTYFQCPICGGESFYSGVCIECINDAEDYEDVAMEVENYYKQVRQSIRVKAGIMSALKQGKKLVNYDVVYVIAYTRYGIRLSGGDFYS